jgi:hypothetical protein
MTVAVVDEAEVRGGGDGWDYVEVARKVATL